MQILKKHDRVLWKEYGFQHIMKSPTVTYCGNDLSWRLVRPYLSPMKVNDNPKNRPLCGTCRKIEEHGDPNEG